MNVELSGLSREDLEQISSLIGKHQNAILKISPADLQRLEQAQPITNKISIRARRMSEVTTDFIEFHPNIIKFELIARDVDILNNEDDNVYTREEMLAIRKEVDSIIGQVQIPPEGAQDREKLIFTQVYSILAQKMKYDHEPIKKENEKNTQMQKTCSNLYGGLVNGKCVCTGYANILPNILSCFEIQAKYIGAPHNPDIDNGEPYGHAWNEVYLDGKSYLTDLTWDRNNICAGHFPLNFFLKSKDDFKHNDFIFNVEKGECEESLSINEQLDLFRQIGYDIPEPEEKSEQTQNNISVLSSLVIASAGQITSSQIRNAAKKIERSISISERKESTIDGRNDEDDRNQ